MKTFLRLATLMLIAANVAAHALGGWRPAPGPDFSVLVRLGWPHYLQMGVLLALLLLARTTRDRFCPGLVAALALAAAAGLARLRPEQLTATGLDLLTGPFLGVMTALAAASAASSAVPPPEERPGLTGFKKAAALLSLFNFGLLILCRQFSRAEIFFHYPAFQATALGIVFSLGLLLVCGRWANLSFIAGLAAVTPLLTAVLVLSGQPTRPPHLFVLYGGQTVDFQLAFLGVLCGLTALISIALKAGVRLTGRARKRVRPLARSLALIPAWALVAAALLWPAARQARRELPERAFAGPMNPLALADLRFQVPDGFTLAEVRCRLPLPPEIFHGSPPDQTADPSVPAPAADRPDPAGPADYLVLVERQWRSEEEAEAVARDIDARLRSQPRLRRDGLSGDYGRLFGRPSWLVITPETGEAGSDARRLFLELYLHYPGGALKLSAALNYRPDRPDDPGFDSFTRRSVERFLEAASQVVARYRRLPAGGEGRAGFTGWRTAFGLLDPAPEGAYLTAVLDDRPRAADEFFAVSSQADWDQPAGEPRDPDHWLKWADWDRLASLGFLNPPPRKDAEDRALGSTLYLSRGRSEAASPPPDRRITAWPEVDRGLRWYQGYRLFKNFYQKHGELAGELEQRYFRRPLPGLAANSNGRLMLTWAAADPSGRPLGLGLVSGLTDYDPALRDRRLAETLGRFQAAAASFSLTDFSARAGLSPLTEPVPDEFFPLTEPVPEEDESPAEADQALEAPEETAPWLEPVPSETPPARDSAEPDPDPARYLTEPDPSPVWEASEHTIPPGLETPEHTIPPGLETPEHTTPPGLETPEYTALPGLETPEYTALPDQEASEHKTPPVQPTIEKKMFNPTPAPSRSGSR